MPPNKSAGTKEIVKPRGQKVPTAAQPSASSDRRRPEKAHREDGGNGPEVERGIDDVHKSRGRSSESAHHDARGKVRESKAFPIVGIGASAGGLEAMTELLRHLPRDTGMAFVLVQHLDPTHESALTSLLSRSTPMVVSEIENNMDLERDHLYVIPPNKMMGLADGKLKLLRARKAGDAHTD
jgi:chemotaxis response regulator CheB